MISPCLNVVGGVLKRAGGRMEGLGEIYISSRLCYLIPHPIPKG